MHSMDLDERKNSRGIVIAIAAAVVFLAAFGAYRFFRAPRMATPDTTGRSGSVFRENFDAEGTLEEASDMAESDSVDWWLNSGAYLIKKDGIGTTILGDLPENSSWRERYRNYNPETTDDGAHPQNLFRLITRDRWTNAEQEVRFAVFAAHKSDTDFRNESNGVLLMHRYRDDNNFYYAGVRVDGTAVIKKKVSGVYYTLAFADIFTNPSRPYHAEDRWNLIPENTWMGIRSRVEDSGDGTIGITLFIDRNNDGSWLKILETTDTAWRFGVPTHGGAGFAGIRTDFMDVGLDNYRIQEVR